MPQPYSGYISDDGKKIGTEDDVLRYEIEREVRAQFPGMRSSIGFITENLDWWATLLARVPSKTEKPPLEAQEPPLDHGELAGSCDCSAAMNGASDHLPSCPAFVATYVDPSFHEPKLKAVNG